MQQAISSLSSPSPYPVSIVIQVHMWDFILQLKLEGKDFGE